MSNSSFINHYNNIISKPRDIKKVPYVELFNGRLQGVVSSGSDIQRVYVSFFEAESIDFYCSTNNNRPCGGLRGYACKHLESVLIEAITQYGIEQVICFLKPSDKNQINTIHDILARAGAMKKESASDVFSRFLNYLRYLELDSSNSPLPEMSWFV